MAAFFDPMIEEFLCSICLEVFDDPVSTTCGHNFCKICLNTHWDNSQYYSCPICKKNFKQRPDLRTNIALRELVVHHKKTQEKEAEISELLEMMEEKEKAVEKHAEDLKQEITEQKRRNAELEMIVVRQRTAGKQYEDLINNLELVIADLKGTNIEPEMMEERQKATEEQYEDVVKDLKTRNTELQVKISHTENNLRLIQEELRQQQISSSCSCMCWLIVLFGGCILFVKLALFIDHEAEWKCMKQSAVDVTLDRDTAHPNLILSYDKKQVRYGDTALNLPDYSRRFDGYLNVMGKEGFSSGRFYFEVQVKGKDSWIVGVARESAKRKGDASEWHLTPVNGFWTVARYGNEYKAHAGPNVSLSLGVKPQKVGVLIIYKVGLVSFYDVDSRSHIYSFTGQTFTEKLYPVLNPCGNAEGANPESLIIASVYYN